MDTFMKASALGFPLVVAFIVVMVLVANATSRRLRAQAVFECIAAMEDTAPPHVASADPGGVFQEAHRWCDEFISRGGGL